MLRPERSEPRAGTPSSSGPYVTMRPSFVDSFDPAMGLTLRSPLQDTLWYEGALSPNGDIGLKDRMDWAKAQAFERGLAQFRYLKAPKHLRMLMVIGEGEIALGRLKKRLGTDLSSHWKTGLLEMVTLGLVVAHPPRSRGTRKDVTCPATLLALSEACRSILSLVGIEIRDSPGVRS